MRSFVINLDRSPERWTFMCENARSVGIPIERSEAVDGRDLGPADLQRWVGRSFLRHTLSAGELACFLSHRKVWAQIADGPDPYGAVFEDDVTFSTDIAHFLDRDEWIPDGADIVRLETFLIKVAYASRPGGVYRGRAVRRLLSSDFGGAGYIISRECCRKLLTGITRLGDPWDELLFNRKSPMFGACAVYQIDPALCIQVSRLTPGSAPIPSTLYPERRAAKRSGLAKIRHEIHRVASQLRHAPHTLWVQATGLQKVVPFQ